MSTAELHTFSFRLPRLSANRVTKVDTEVERIIVPAELGTNEDRRELGIAIQEIWIE